MNTKPNYLIVVWHHNEDQSSSRGHVIATAENFYWANYVARREFNASGGWDYISVHNNDKTWSYAQRPEPASQPSDDDYCPF